HSTAQQPENETKSPSGFGSVGVKGRNLYDRSVLNPAASAASRSTNGVSAVTAWLMSVQQSVRSYPLLSGGATLSDTPCTPVMKLIGPPSRRATSGPTT